MYGSRSHLALCASLTLAILVLAVWVSPARAQDEPGAKAIVKMAEDLAAGKKISEADAKAFAQKYDDLEEVMHAFKRGKGKPSLEQILNKLSSKSTFSAEEKSQLTTTAKLAQALAIVTPHYDSKTKGSAAKKKDWDKYNTDMAEGAKDLLKALGGSDGKAIKEASTKLAGSCTDCHGVFR